MSIFSCVLVHVIAGVWRGIFPLFLCTWLIPFSIDSLKKLLCSVRVAGRTVTLVVLTVATPTSYVTVTSSSQHTCAELLLWDGVRSAVFPRAWNESTDNCAEAWPASPVSWWVVFILFSFVLLRHRLIKQFLFPFCSIEEILSWCNLPGTGWVRGRINISESGHILSIWSLLPVNVFV